MFDFVLIKFYDDLMGYEKFLNIRFNTIEDADKYVMDNIEALAQQYNRGSISRLQDTVEYFTCSYAANWFDV